MWGAAISTLRAPSGGGLPSTVHPVNFKNPITALIRLLTTEVSKMVRDMETSRVGMTALSGGTLSLRLRRHWCLHLIGSHAPQLPCDGAARLKGVRCAEAFGQVVLNAFAFALQVAVDGVCKCRVRQPMRAGGLNGHQCACHFVLALCATFEAFDAMGQAPLDGLVVTGLEMQAVHPFQRPPVAAIGHFWVGIQGFFCPSSLSLFDVTAIKLQAMGVGVPLRCTGDVATHSSQLSELGGGQCREKGAAQVGRAVFQVRAFMPQR